VHILLVYGFAPGTAREPPPAGGTPATLDGWRLRKVPVGEAVQEVLRADDTGAGLRGDTGASGLPPWRHQSAHGASRFISAAGRGSDRSIHRISLPGRTTPARVNRYLVAKGENKTLVLTGIRPETGHRQRVRRQVLPARRRHSLQPHGYVASPDCGAGDEQRPRGSAPPRRPLRAGDFPPLSRLLPSEPGSASARP
jgi:hypothetical protein